MYNLAHIYPILNQIILMCDYSLSLCIFHIQHISGKVANSLRDVYVMVPNAVRRGDTASLICHYDLEGDDLYSVNWYKGRQEFYGYTPKEMPTMKIFNIAGIAIIVSINQLHENTIVT